MIYHHSIYLESYIDFLNNILRNIIQRTWKKQWNTFLSLKGFPISLLKPETTFTYTKKSSFDFFSLNIFCKKIFFWCKASLHILKYLIWMSRYLADPFTDEEIRKLLFSVSSMEFSSYILSNLVSSHKNQNLCTRSVVIVQ